MFHLDDVACGFPMSRHLNATGAVLGRTARMLACQNVLKHHSVTTGKSFLSVYRRAVLQVTIVRGNSCSSLFLIIIDDYQDTLPISFISQVVAHWHLSI